MRRGEGRREKERRKDKRRLEHLTWTACRSTWRHTTKECPPPPAPPPPPSEEEEEEEQPGSLWEVTASVEVQPMGSSRLRRRCCPSSVYTLDRLRLTDHGKASPGGGGGRERERERERERG
ncbi:hypothetical protein EYF80_052601 [Liparis tanakae]|uniref:Uncharacterized protein n=1 Tax=Liparis tanakae TaxID=230148 RepID=A0A4Z2F8A2_9TELE|nr:hypothetical protein EYF80_052601 [Liparis tanakae]